VQVVNTTHPVVSGWQMAYFPAASSVTVAEGLGPFDLSSTLYFPVACSAGNQIAVLIVPITAPPSALRQSSDSGTPLNRSPSDRTGARSLNIRSCF